MRVPSGLAGVPVVGDRLRSVTIVIPTHRRHASLERLLHAVAAQRDPGLAWDVVVVDNEDAPGAELAFQRAAAALPISARYVRESAKGASNTRNRGIAEATGDIIAFLDDDVVPREDWLREVVGPIMAGRFDGVGGRVLLDDAVPHPSWLRGYQAAYLAAYDLGDEEQPLAVNEDAYLLTANAAFDAAVLRATGGFDPLLGPRPEQPTVNDDLDICRRVRSVGGSIGYSPNAVVVHDLPPERLTLRYMVRRAYAQGVSDYLVDRERLEAFRFGAIKGRGIEAVRDVGRILRRGPWRSWVAMSLVTSVARSVGFGAEAVRAKAHSRSKDTT